MLRSILALTALAALTACSGKFKGDGDDPSSQDDGSDDDWSGGGSDGGGDEGGDDGGDDGGEEDDGVVGDTYTDDDGDGFTEDEGDCDDGDAEVAPNQAEECNGVDDDCNGQIDETGSDGLVYYDDSDGDGYGNPSTATEDCDQPPGTVTNGEDCDDTSANARPGGVEISWNGVDEDCDGSDVDLDSCVADAINATSEEMTEALWAIDAYEGTYAETITGLGLPVADWSIANQYMYLVESSTQATATATTAYDTTFEVDVGMNDSAYSGSYFTAGSDIWYEGPFWIDVSMDELYAYLGLSYTTWCDAWVDPVGHSFQGSLELTVNETSQTVSGDSQLDSNRTVLTADDVNTQSVTGEAVCQIDVVDTIIDQLGYGNTLGILDETFEVTLTSLEEIYEDTLEANVDLYCSAS